MEYITYEPRALQEANYDRIAPARVGVGLKGRGNKGEGTGAGSNIIKANAIEEIQKRGPGGGSDPNAWDEGDIGLVGKMMGVSVQDIQNRENSLNLSTLSNKYDKAFEALGVDRRAQFGDSDASLQLALQDAKDARNLKRTEPERVRREKLAETDRVTAINEQIIANNTSERNQTNAMNLQLKRLDDQTDLTREQMRINERNRFDDRKEARAERALERESRAEDRAMQVELEMAKIAQQDRTAKEALQFRREQFQEKKSADLVAAITALGGLFMV